MKIYFQLSLNTKQKPPKKVYFEYNDNNLYLLNYILNKALKNMRLVKREKTKSSIEIIKLLDKIIPNEYFGTTQHRKLFYQIVKRILTQSDHECIYKSMIIEGYNFEAISWMNGINNEKICKILLMKYNIFILEQIVKPLIAFYYKPVKSFASHEIKFIRKEKWHQFESKILNKLKNLEHIVQNEDCLTKKPRGKLKLIPKGPSEELKFRPIISIFPDKNRNFYKYITSKIYAAAREMNSSFSLYECWKSYTENVGTKKIYGVKLDIKDAYGNINVNLLCNIIRELKSEYLNEHDKSFIIEHITNQFIVFRKNVFQWKHGLLQGDRLSSCLCELYMSYLDNLFLPNFGPNCLMYRTVDDYFFCSTEEYEVYKFIAVIKSVHEVNENKTKTNILNNCDEEIPYCGKLFNLISKQVKNLYNFGPRYEIRHKFKLWNLHYQIPQTKMKLFLTKPMAFCYNNNCFTKMEMNTVFNSQNTVLQNFFEGMIYVAYKFDAVVMSVKYRLRKKSNFLLKILEEIIQEYSIKTSRKIQIYKGENYKIPITLQHLKILSYKAFILVLKRRFQVYKPIINEIKHKMNLRVVFDTPKIDYTYFNKLPSYFKNIKINRSVSV